MLAVIVLIIACITLQPFLPRQTCLLQAIRRPFDYAIVDEVDSILIDDCRNPMLISGMSLNPVDRFKVAAQVSLLEQTCLQGR